MVEDVYKRQGYKAITEEEIIASYSVTENENEEDSDSVDEPAVVMTHTEAVANIDKLMVYFEVKLKHHQTSF